MEIDPAGPKSSRPTLAVGSATFAENWSCDNAPDSCLSVSATSLSNPAGVAVETTTHFLRPDVYQLSVALEGLARAR